MGVNRGNQVVPLQHVTVDAAGTMVIRRRAHHERAESSHRRRARRQIGGGRNGALHRGSVPAPAVRRRCVPPHDSPVSRAPVGPAAGLVQPGHLTAGGAPCRDRPARWRRRSGCGVRVSPVMPQFVDHSGVEGRLSSAVDRAYSACSRASTSSTFPKRRLRQRLHRALDVPRRWHNDFFLLHVGPPTKRATRTRSPRRRSRAGTPRSGPLVAALRAAPRRSCPTTTPCVDDAYVGSVRISSSTPRNRERAAPTGSAVADRPVVIAHTLMERLVA